MGISAKPISLHADVIFNVLIKCCEGEPMLMHRPYLDKYILVIKPLASIRNYKKVIKIKT